MTDAVAGQSPPEASADGFWNGIAAATFASEAEVELKLVIPLLHALGYADNDIEPKSAVRFFYGKQGRPHEADFIAFAAAPHGRNTSLLVVETKHPSESLELGKDQAESYAMWARAPLYLLTNGVRTQLWQMQSAFEASLVLEIQQTSMASVRGRIEALLRKQSVIALCDSLKLKVITFESIDVSAYLDARVQLLRRQGETQWVERTLRQAGREGKISSKGLFNFHTFGGKNVLQKLRQYGIEL